MCIRASVRIFTAFPLFINAIALFVLRKKFWTLLDDYKARYLSIGQVDPSFSVFAEAVSYTHLTGMVSRWRTSAASTIFMGVPLSPEVTVRL